MLNDPTAGWPAAPAADAAGDDRFWAKEPDETVIREESSAEIAATGWAAPDPETWPAAPELATAEAEAAESTSTVTLLPESGTDNGMDEHGESADATSQAEHLLDELREVIAAMGQAARTETDLSGVISDLEVGLAPPEALNGDALAELRDALHAARERPRDIDTIVDLTRRVDAMVALMIAYDRAIAAIERSLNVLRR